MRYRRHLSLVVTGFLVILPLLFFAGTVSGRDAALRGLAGVLIDVDIDDILTSEGLSKRQIISDIELILQQAGVKVLSNKQWRKTEGHPRLFVQIAGNKVQENWPFFTFAINIQLHQDVYISRSGQTELIQASTWFNIQSGYGYVGDIRLQIKEIVGTFAADYLAANQM